MIVHETDIVFEKLSGSEFEELCFDLLLRLQFHSLVWRQGGADKGRDIEALYSTSNPVIGSYNEKWFVECKNHKSGINVDELNSKVAWAKAEKPEHLLIIVSSYLTEPTRDWLKKVTSKSTSDTPFLTHVIEGKALKALLLQFPDLVNKYFATDFYKLLRGSMEFWLIHDILPAPDALFAIYNQMDVNKLHIEEMVFIFCSYILRGTELEAWIEDDMAENPVFSLEELLPYIAKHQNCDEHTSPNLIANISSWTSGSTPWDYLIYDVLTSKTTIQYEGEMTPALYCLIRDENKDAIEVAILRRRGFKSFVRCFSCSDTELQNRVSSFLKNRHK